MCRTEVGLYGRESLFKKPHTKSFIGNPKRTPDPAEPGGRPKWGPRVHEEAEALGRSKDWSGPKLPSSRPGASGAKAVVPVRGTRKSAPAALGYSLPTPSVPYQNDIHCVVPCTALVLRPRSGGFIVIIDPPSLAL